MSDTIAAALAALSTTLLLGSVEAGHYFHLRTYARVRRDTLDREHAALRKRAYQNVWRDLSTWECVKKCELSHGWVWFRVQGIPPQRGRMPIENHLEQSGWAWTRRGARRRMRNTPPARHIPVQQPVGVTRPSARR